MNRITRMMSCAALIVTPVVGACDEMPVPESADVELADQRPDAAELDQLHADEDIEDSDRTLDPAAPRDLTAPTDPSYFTGWTAYTSEELPPVTCGNSRIALAHCSGSYCDKLRVYCTSSGVIGDSSWTTYFSEEGTSNYRICATGQWMTGVDCSGDYCDNVSIQCTAFAGTHTDCHWSGWHSEEYGGLLQFPAGYFARGAECGGSSCDDMRYLLCKAQ